MKNRKSIELILLPFYFVLIAFFVLHFHLEYVGTVILFFGIPALYFSLQNEKWLLYKNLKIGVFVGMVIGLTMDFIGTKSGAWFETSLSGIRVLGTFPIEALLWSILSCFFMSSFYNYFLNAPKSKRVFTENPRKYFGLVTGTIVFIGVFLVLFVLFTSPQVLYREYMYLWILIGFCVLPPFLMFLLYPRFLPKMLVFASYLLVLGLIFEYAALSTGQWAFSGLYVGHVHILSVAFPIEEVVWWFLAPMGFGIFYEYYFGERE